ncbi:MAG: hypothetical protein IPF96_13365 [Rhodobacter sp.]|nr:hypothetical protein [Rhodobacter sp.]
MPPKPMIEKIGGEDKVLNLVEHFYDLMESPAAGQDDHGDAPPGRGLSTSARRV